MKKYRFILLLTIFFIITCPLSIFAAHGYEFKIQYEGNILENVEKDAKILLVGTKGEEYSKARVIVESTGPAKATVYAKDKDGKEFDMSKNDGWGPSTGFAIKGDFTNTTAVRITFPEAGKYTTTLKLIDTENDNEVITSNTFEFNVLTNKPAIEENTQEPVESLPQTGIEWYKYIIYVLVIILLIMAIYLIIKSKKNKS